MEKREEKFSGNSRIMRNIGSFCGNPGTLPFNTLSNESRANFISIKGPELLNKKLGNLSGGELQRVLLAFALEPMPDLLLLDEPVSAVDRRGIEVFYELVCSLRVRYHMPVILVSHDLSHVRQYATSAALLDRTIRISGEVEKVMASREVRETFGLPAPEGEEQ